MKMYCVREIGTKNYLNYSEKKVKFFGGVKFYTVHSPFPTLRPKQHIKKNFQKWIDNTPNPLAYEIVEVDI